MKKTRTILLLLSALLLLAGAGLLQRHLLNMQRSYGMSQADPLENSSPLISFTTIAFGGFRGLLADALWLRAAQMQREGRFFEMVQLAEWITQLEPRFAEVWAFQAWNLAYNISVLFDTPEDRWRWVQSGISLLRDEGLKYNPGDSALYYELAWLFMHKIGSGTDTANAYYKKVWADEMNELTSEAARPETFSKYRMDPVLMQEIEQEYGPLDWHQAQTHAIYWAEQGRKIAHGNDQLMLDRLIYQSLAQSFLGSSLDGTDSSEAPNIALLPYTLKTYQRVLRDHPHNASLSQAYFNFLLGALTACTTHGMEPESEEIFDILKTEYPNRLNVDTLDEFVKAEHNQPLQHH